VTTMCITFYAAAARRPALRSTVVEAPAADPGITDDGHQPVAETMAAGAPATIFLPDDSPRATDEELVCPG
jgi:hypothetical protein